MLFKSSFTKSLGASSLTSLLMLLDRLVLNFIPLFFWGVSEAGLWIVLRSWAFILMSLEGGFAGRLSKSISANQNESSKQVIQSKVSFVRRRSLFWGGGIFV